MGGMITGPKMPALPVTPPPPAAADARQAANDARSALAMRQGRASTLLTGSQGAKPAPAAVKTLLGH